MAAERWDVDCDVVVAGMGAAGCAAAIEAHDRGATVVVLEKMAAGLEGGNTRVSGGIWFDNASPQRAAVYLRSLCGGLPLPDEVIRVWSEETHANSAWIESLGGTVASHGDYRPEYPELDGSDCFAGYLGVDGQMGQGLLYGLLSAAVRSRSVEVHLGTPARSLIEVDGEVVGVVAEQDGRSVRVRARRGVVLATGGFEANPTMVHDYLGLSDVPGTWGSPGGTGDGIRMAQQLGADLWHMDNMMTAPGLRVPGFAAAFYTPFGGPLPYLYVGPDGTRFVDETTVYRHGHALRHGRYELYPTQPMTVIFDERTRLAGPVSPGTDVLPVGWNLLIEGYQWSADNSVEIDKGWIKRGDTLAELAGALSLPPETVVSTVDRFNRSCAAGRDEQFGRPPETMLPLAEPPFYGFGCGPILGWSNGGPRRNERAQVLDVTGRVIPRLYAAGNISSTYSWCKDGGFHIADALAFGRVAGRCAAAESRSEAALSQLGASGRP